MQPRKIPWKVKRHRVIVYDAASPQCCFSVSQPWNNLILPILWALSSHMGFVLFWIHWEIYKRGIFGHHLTGFPFWYLDILQWRPNAAAFHTNCGRKCLTYWPLYLPVLRPTCTYIWPIGWSSVGRPNCADLAPMGPHIYAAPSRKVVRIEIDDTDL